VWTNTLLCAGLHKGTDTTKHMVATPHCPELEDRLSVGQGCRAVGSDRSFVSRIIFRPGFC
jgi:hypothetical protein